MSIRIGPSKHSRGGVMRFGLYDSHEISITVIDNNGEPESIATVSLAPYIVSDPGKHGGLAQRLG
jgi:hypothetical protein